MGLLDGTTQQQYYSGDDYGSYQFTSLEHIINQFMVAYVGENKIIPKVKRTDVQFHAMRALQELSFDTLKSCKSQEVEVCANLKMALPQDYVNYVKLTRVDSAGIEHIIYPTSKTSNPFAVTQTQDDCDDCGDTSDTYQYISGATTSQTTSCGAAAEVTCTFSTTNMDASSHKGANQVGQYIDQNLTTFNTSALRQAYWEKWFGHVDEYCLCLQNSESEDNCGEQLDWLAFDGGITTGIWGSVDLTTEMSNRAGWAGLRNPQGVVTTIIDRTVAKNGNWPEPTSTVTLTTPTSDTWDSYSGATPSENQDDYQDNTYWAMASERYGLDPQHAQVNGSYFIDCLRGTIHFSSNLSGKTIILKYISDSLGSDDEMVVHKFAEEAMYKHIAYAILSTLSNIPEYIINRFRRERFATKRVAKLRLSNIKLEEITQVLRGKSKQIKH